MCRIISFVASAGGVGQTSLIFELSKMLSERNFRVCVFDAHFNFNVLSLKYDDGQNYDLMDYIVKNINATDVLCTASSHLKIVKTNCVTFNYLKYSELIKNFIEEISVYFDYILIDSNSAAKNQLSLALECSNEAILILTDEFFAIRSGAKILQKIYFYENILSVNIVLNKMRVIAEFAGSALGEKEIAEIFKIDPLFVFPLFYKNNIFKRKKKPLKFDELLSQFCSSLIHNQRYEFDYKKQYHGVLGLIRRKIYAKYE